MADLPTVTDHLNDIEIAANAPLTETLMRRLGSNINYLLDFLGIADGTTDPGSAAGLSDFFAAVNTINNHTITNVATTTGTGFTNIGTFTHKPFIDHVFLMRKASGPANVGHNQTGGSSLKLFKNLDSLGRVAFNAAKTTPASTTPALAGTINDFEIQNVLSTTSVFGGGAVGAFNQIIDVTSNARKAFNDGGLGTIGYQNVMRASEWVEVGTLSWREFSTNAGIEATSATFPSVQIWLAYRLNLQSAPLIV